MSQILVFMGPPGAGKGSLSQQCLQRYDWRQLSTGALCRKHIFEQTAIGKQIDFAIQSGKLIDDSLIISMVEEWLHDNVSSNKSIILDGFPRTGPQARLLIKLVAQEFPSYSLNIIRLLVHDEVVVHRLAGRAMCENKDCQAVYSLYNINNLAPKVEMTCDACKGHLVRRLDDEEPTAIRYRLRQYHDNEQALLETYKEANISIEEINVECSLEEVFNTFDQLMNAAVV